SSPLPTLSPQGRGRKARLTTGEGELGGQLATPGGGLLGARLRFCGGLLPGPVLLSVAASALPAARRPGSGRSPPRPPPPRAPAMPRTRPAAGRPPAAESSSTPRTSRACPAC